MNTSIIIGSRAWDQNYEDSFLGSDWDVVMNKQDLIFILKAPDGYVTEVSYDSVKDFKYRFKQRPNRVVEVELMGAFKSTKLLEELKEEGARPIDIWPAPSFPATPLTCLVLKASHITFPINWRKTAAHLSEMKTWFKADSLNSLIESDPQCELFKQLFEVRSKETLARYLSKTKSRAVSNANLKEKKASLWDEQAFSKFTPVDQSDTIYLPTTDTSISKSKFSSGSVEYKLEVVQRQLELIAGLYFVDHPALMQLSPEARVTEIYLLAFQTFCCQQVAAEMPVNNQHSLAKKTYHVYERFREVPAYQVNEVLELARKLTETDVTELPLPSDEQVSASPLGNPVIQWLVDHWTESTLVPSQSFNDFVARHSTEHQKPNDIVLPPELMEMIFGQIDEHVTYCSVTSLNKYYRALYNSNEAWKRLVEKCWTEDQLKYSELKEQPPSSKKEKRKQQQIRWREIFVEMYDRALKESFVLCGHCHSFHDAVAHGKEDRDESEWDHCACKECDAGSWSTCLYADDYTWAD